MRLTRVQQILTLLNQLIIAVGAHTQTFNIPGVREHAFFLKENRDAIKIRKRILRCELYWQKTGLFSNHFQGFEEASLPSTTEERKNQLLHFCIVGGGRKSHCYCSGKCLLYQPRVSSSPPSYMT
jgi:NADH dehydrogenase FAD-containing subunit